MNVLSFYRWKDLYGELRWSGIVGVWVGKYSLLRISLYIGKHTQTNGVLILI